MNDTVKLEVSGRNGLILLNRPDKRNAIDDDMMQGLQDCLLEAEQDQIEPLTDRLVTSSPGTGRLACSWLLVRVGLVVLAGTSHQQEGGQDP